MADKKISALTGATTPLAGTEVLPIVQGGNTVKVSVANLTAGRSIATNDIVASGELTSTTNNARISLYRSTGTNYFDWASGQTLAFGTQTSQGGAGRVSKVNFLDNGDVTNVTGNFVVGTAGKGIDFSANANAPGMTSELLTWYEEGTWTPSYSGWSVDPTTAYAKYTRVGRLVTLHYVAENGTAAAASGVIGGLPFTSNAQQGASVAMKDNSFNSPGVTAFATIGPNSTNIQSMTAVGFAGLYWSFSVTYMV